jgi:flagellar biosynthetic protein FliR
MVISYLQLEIFLLVLARIIGIFIMAPLFSARSFPAFGKIAFAIWLAAVMWFVVPIQPEKLPTLTITFFLAMLTEVVIGFLMGFVANLIFIVVQSAGEFVDLQMGLSVASAFDPLFGASISIIGRMSFYIAITVFVIANGHHMLLSALNQSFKLFPPGSAINLTSPMLMEQMISLMRNFWLISFQLAGPIILIIFLSDFAFGIVSRVAPQVNVFMLGFQVKPVLGLLGLVFIMPLLVKHVANLLGIMAEELLKLMVALRI